MPTVFVQFETGNETNPVAMAIGKIVELPGGMIVDQLVDDQDLEADIAVTNRVETALRILKETENTRVLLGYMGSTGWCASKAEADAFAARFPERVKSCSFIGGKDEGNLVLDIMGAIAQTRKEDK